MPKLLKWTTFLSRSAAETSDPVSVFFPLQQDKKQLKTPPLSSLALTGVRLPPTYFQRYFWAGDKFFFFFL